MFTLLPAFKYGWQEMQKKLGLFLILTLIFSAGDIGSSFLLKDVVIDENMSIFQMAEAIPSNYMLYLAGISFVLVILNFFVVVFVLAGLRGVQPMTYFRMKVKLFPAYILLMIIKIIVIGIGLMLFIIPGLILLLALYFMEYLLIDNEVKIFDTFKASWEMTRGYRTGIFFFELNLFVIGMFLSFPQSFWPDTIMTYAIMIFINVAWLPFSWNAQGWIYQMISQRSFEK